MTVTPAGQAATTRTPGRPRSTAADVAIAQATRELLAEVGWSGLTMEAVAHRAGIAKTTLYRRYASPAELAVAAVAGIVAVADTGAHGTAQEDITSAVNAVAEVISHPEASAAYLAAVSESYRNADVRRFLDKRVLRPGRQLVADGVARAVERGEVTIEESELDARIDLLFDLLVGAMVHRVLIRGIALDEPFLTALTTSVLATMHLS